MGGTQTVTIPGLTQTKYVSVRTGTNSPGPDLILEGTETFAASLSTATSDAAALGTTTTATGTILDASDPADADAADFDTDKTGATGEDDFTEGDTGTTEKNILLTIKTAAATREAPIKLDYKFSDGTGTKDLDYRGVDGTITVPASATLPYSAKIPVTIIGDTLKEAGGNYETFKVTLSSSNGTVHSADLVEKTFEITEEAGDALPTWTTADVSVQEGNTGTTTAKIPITLSGKTSSATTVNATFTSSSAVETGVNSGATAGDNDFDLPLTRSVTIPAGSTTGFIEVPVNGDTVYERDEAFSVVLTTTSTDVSAAETADAVHTARVFITNDDAKPTMTLNQIAGTEGTSVRVTGTINGVSQLPYTLGITAAGSGDSPATVAKDFEAPAAMLSTPISVTRGQTGALAANIGEIYLLPDDIDEATETFSVTATETTASPVGFVTSAGAFRITDDPADVPPAGSIRDESIGEDEGSVDVHVDFKFDENTKETTQTVQIPWTTVDGSAKAGDDYEYAKGILQLKPGDLSATVNVEILNDKLKENEENFYVKLGTPITAGAAVDKATGEVTIKSEDVASPVTPTLSVTGPARGVGAAKFMGTAAPNTNVELWGSPLPNTDPTKMEQLTDVNADDDGYFEFAPRSIASGWAFVVQSQDINSAVRTVKVTQLPSFAASSPKKGQLSVSVAGNPRATGQAVTVQRYTGGKWVNVGKGTTTATGWKGTFKFKSKTKLTLRAHVAGNAAAGINAGYSSQKKVTVK
ncbi:Calx-beta domain-containing protein [Actinoplanes sp. NPDC049802]|uniref:Calx-beta domain-containing protein n=1 Tax=Actinoplanes sp. NPDC049802 TaxID=3154742 RepID=UPI0034025A28